MKIVGVTQFNKNWTDRAKIVGVTVTLTPSNRPGRFVGVRVWAVLGVRVIFTIFWVFKRIVGVRVGEIVGTTGLSTL